MSVMFMLNVTCITIVLNVKLIASRLSKASDLSIVQTVIFILIIAFCFYSITFINKNLYNVCSVLF